MRLPFSFGLAGLLLAIAAPAEAATLYVPLDRSVRVNVPGVAASVVIGNPAVADVTVVDSHTLYVSGHGFGGTDLQVLDAGGRTLVSTTVLVSPPDSGHVSVYRGARRTDLACSPGCQTSPNLGQPPVGLAGTGASRSAPDATEVVNTMAGVYQGMRALAPG